MLRVLKKKLYFVVAWYFRIFAIIRLKRWNPKVVMVTGSSGKTTTLHLIKARLGDVAKYSLKANSAIGIPFDLLDLKRKTLLRSEWPSLFLLAPFRAFKKPPKERLYIAEADCDRPGEGKFLGSLLKPDITLWISSSKTHSMNFDQLVVEGKFKAVEDAIKNEFYKLVSYTRKHVLKDASIKLSKSEKSNLNAKVIDFDHKNNLDNYIINKSGVTFVFGKNKYLLPQLLPEVVASSLLMIEELIKILGIKAKNDYVDFEVAPGRGSFFGGINKITIVDSTYNANLDSMKVVIDSFSKLSGTKWVVLGDMLELGKSEKTEHEELAKPILANNFDNVVLMGPRVSKSTKPVLEKEGVEVVSFISPKEVLDFLKVNVKGEEVILFKGARFLEGVIEHLLKNKEDIKKLGRREKIWEKRRKKWGL